MQWSFRWSCYWPWAVLPDEFFITICFVAVVGGSVFGDQCSSISDTPTLSSLPTGCYLMDQLKTKSPWLLLRLDWVGCAPRLPSFFVREWYPMECFAKGFLHVAGMRRCTLFRANPKLARLPTVKIGA